ncbi:response regulator [Paenibacillus cremeus]|uniref:Response regulator n=1 Tax=Paenibacillus cremeus TaxID=2163881 RepID=A0A559KFP3_9BACL|nr:response regulator [Paenibacillus cremeus]TVY10939.1 response regulator [Paenibacillus cremeus]
MLRLLIVDDEILVRIGLKTIIPLQGDEFEIIGEAATGKEALAMLEQTPCDIVLTDIRMPDMDGLELLKHIHERWPDTKTFILSNHSDFAYVQTALRLGAAEYMIKLEIEPEELMRKLRDVRQKMLGEREKRLEMTQLESKVNRYGREVKEKRLRELLLHPATRRETEEWLSEFGVPTLQAELTVTLIRIDAYERLLAANRFQSERLLQFTVANVLTEIMKKYGAGELTPLDHGMFAVMKEAPVLPMLEEMERAVGTFLKLSLSFGVSRSNNGMYRLHYAYMEAREALEHLFYRTGDSRIMQREALPEYKAASSESMQLDEAQWNRLIEEKDEAGMRRLLDDWVEDSLVAMNVPPVVLRERWIRLADCFARCLKAEGADIYAVTLHDGRYPYHVIRQAETLVQLRDWFSGWIPVFLEYLKRHGRGRWRSEVQTVVARIQERLHLSLKVSELAAEIGFTENYLSILFKKETGETITDYITRMRMKKARELLKDPEIKIYEVSGKVGYGDPNHFSRSFKQMEGMYPTEFRKLVLGKS